MDREGRDEGKPVNIGKGKRGGVVSMKLIEVWEVWASGLDLGLALDIYYHFR